MTTSQEIREALQAATPGPWAVSDKYVVQDRYDKDDFRQAVFKAQHIPKMKADLHLIANAPEWLKWQDERITSLLSELDAKTAESELWQKQNKLLVKNNVTYKEQIESLQQQLDAAKQENERLTRILQTPAITEEDYELIWQRLKQAEEALEKIGWGSLGVDNNGMFIQPYEVARKTLSLIRGEVGNPSLKGE